jgi:hypothetical protein
MLQARLGGTNQDILARAGKFLSTPAEVGKNTLFPVGSGESTPAIKNTFDLILNVLTIILRLLIFRS